jgi:hypothetical protein
MELRRWFGKVALLFAGLWVVVLIALVAGIAQGGAVPAFGGGMDAFGQGGNLSAVALPSTPYAQPGT